MMAAHPIVSIPYGNVSSGELPELDAEASVQKRAAASQAMA